MVRIIIECVNPKRKDMRTDSLITIPTEVYHIAGELKNKLEPILIDIIKAVDEDGEWPEVKIEPVDPDEDDGDIE